MKRYLTNMVISAVKPNVPKTKLQKKTRDLKLAIQKNKGSKAKKKSLGKLPKKVRNKMGFMKKGGSVK